MKFSGCICRAKRTKWLVDSFPSSHLFGKKKIIAECNVGNAILVSTKLFRWMKTVR